MFLPLLFVFFAGFALILGFWPVSIDNRPKLQLKLDDPLSGLSLRLVPRTRKRARRILFF